MIPARKPKLAVWKFASCDGCQLSLLDLEDELLLIADAVHIANFMEATRAVTPGPYDVSLVEGSITTEHDAERIHEIRKESGILIAIGACANTGGIQSLRNFNDVNNYVSAVYAHPEFIHTLEKSTPISEHVKVDLELQGCPVNKYQLLEVLNAYLNGRKANLPEHSVCLDCKRKGNACVMVSHGMPCLGPVTLTGCDALCPTFRRGCFGCYGPIKNAAASPLTETLISAGMKNRDIIHLYRNFNAWSETFRKESVRLEATGK